MGRLVRPISQEDFEKLPKWQQWVSKHPIICIGGMFVLFFLILVCL